MDRILAQWRRERPDLDVAAIGLFGRLFRSAHLADEALSEGIAPHGLQPGWFDLLAALRRSGKPYELNPTTLMETTMLSSGGMTKRLDRLDEAGLVERRPDPSDRRGTLIRLTRRGKAIIDKAVETHAQERGRAAAIADGVGSAHPRRPACGSSSPDWNRRPARRPRRSGVRTIPRVGPVAQPGLEQGAFNPRVAGSNPARPTSSDVGARRLRSPGCGRSWSSDLTTDDGSRTRRPPGESGLAGSAGDRPVRTRRCCSSDAGRSTRSGCGSRSRSCSSTGRGASIRVVRASPGRFLFCRRARHVLECHVGADVRVGDVLSLRAAPGGRATRGDRDIARPART